MALTERRRRRRVVVGAAAVAFVLIECLRVWFPSIHLLVGENGTASSLIAVVVLASLAVAPVLATQLGRITGRTLWAVGGTMLVAGRAALLVTDGGVVQTFTATLAVVGASIAITALAAGGPTPHQTRIGILVGVAAATLLHAVTRTAGLVWSDARLATIGSVLVVLVLAAAVLRTEPALRGPEEHATPAAAWPWLVLMPLLLLVTQISGVPGRLAVVTGWPAPTVAMAITATHAAAVLAALVASRLGPVSAGWSGAALVLVGTVGSMPAVGWPAVAGPMLLAVGLGLIVGVDAEDVGGHTTRRRHAQVAASSMLLFGIVTTLYYLSYQVTSALNNRLLLLGTAVLAAGIGLAIARTGRMAITRVRLDVRAVLRAVMVAIVIVGLAGIVTDGSTRPMASPPDDDRLRVALLNARSSFDPDARFVPREQARTLRASTPDVVVLNEVDRGWLSTGGHDALALFGAEMGLPHVTFAPAADEIWGNAILTRFPIAERSATRLPRGRDTMSRSELSVVLDLPDGRQLGVIATHLSLDDPQGDTRLPQARAVAAAAARLRERQIPTVVAGSLHVEADSPELATFAPLVEEVLPPGTLTFPAHAPSVQYDHVLASTDLRRVSYQVPGVQISDHLPVIIILEFVGQATTTG